MIRDHVTVRPAGIPDVLLLEPKVWEDSRGFFFESFSARTFEESTGIRRTFVQDNHSCSKRNVLRGLHYQVRHPQGKLVRVVSGEIFDVAVDLRKQSATYGRWTGLRLSAENRRQLWVPEGFAHGFVTLSDHADVLYKMTDYYDPDAERVIAWNDPDLSIAWPVREGLILVPRDAQAPSLRAAENPF